MRVLKRRGWGWWFLLLLCSLRVGGNGVAYPSLFLRLGAVQAGMKRR